MKHIVFSIIILGALAAQAAFYNYFWQPTTGGEISIVDDTKGWKKGGTCYNNDTYCLNKAQSAALTLANDWTVPGGMNISGASNVFDFAPSTLTVPNGFNVEWGGGLLLKSGTINSQGSIYVDEDQQRRCPAGQGGAAEGLDHRHRVI